MEQDPIQAAYSVVGRYRSELRLRVTHRCPVCQELFHALRHARYCSNRCRQTAKRGRRYATRLARRWAAQ